MPIPPFACWMLDQEARALLSRLARVKPFILHEPMLPAAALLPESQIAIERFLALGRKHLRSLVEAFIRWLHSPAAAQVDAEEAQRRFTMLRLRFNRVLTHFDLFENVITQRSENETGVWLSGLDVASADALQLSKQYFPTPPVICYLDRGVGASIRRARTRLPGGGETPVAIVTVPRERMIGSGIASSLFHEVGHQAAALLGLVESLRPILRGLGQSGGSDRDAWRFWERWISEIVADVWSVARAGIASTMGLMGVVSLPRPFVFRVNGGDPHPAPWIRVKLSGALGQAFYPQPAWEQLMRLWDSYYPTAGLDAGRKEILSSLERTIPALVSVLLNHRPRALRGDSLLEALTTAELDPRRLRESLEQWRTAPSEMYRARPIIAFAAIGQGRADGRITPEEEAIVIGKLLSHWAVESTLEVAARCSFTRPHSCGCEGGSGEREQVSHLALNTRRSMSWNKRSFAVA